MKEEEIVRGKKCKGVQAVKNMPFTEYEEERVRGKKWKGKGSTGRKKSNAETTGTCAPKAT